MHFVVCGEALIDMIPGEVVAPNETRWSAMCGGSPMNSAVALARLGQPTQFLGRLGNDSFGTQMERFLESAGVGLELAVRSSDPTTVGILSLDEDGRASYFFHVRGTSNFGWQPDEFPTLGDDVWLHLGSIGTVVDPAFRPVLDFVSRTEAPVSYDINVRPTLLPDREEYFEKVSAYMAAVGSGGGIVKASDEDINFLTDDDEPLAYAEAWAAEHGLAMFLVTLGPDGAVAVRGDGRLVRVPGHRVEVVDTVGAGDTFMAGFLSSYCDNPSDLEAALTRGTAAAAVVCSRKGANPPTLAEIEEFLAR